MWWCDGVREEWECGGVMVLESVGVWGWDGVREEWECGSVMVLGRSGSVGV